MSRHSKVIARTYRHRYTQTDTQTHKQYENITFPHTQTVKMYDWPDLCDRKHREYNHHVRVVNPAC